MKAAWTAIACALLATTVSVRAEPPADPVNDAPLKEKWAPSEWGPDDKVGAVNRITPELVLEATKLVKQGKVATLGKVYSSGTFLFFETYNVVAFLYLTMTISLSLLVRWLERHLKDTVP